jgi:hypothetical protein
MFRLRATGSERRRLPMKRLILGLVLVGACGGSSPPVAILDRQFTGTFIQPQSEVDAMTKHLAEEQASLTSNSVPPVRGPQWIYIDFNTLTSGTWDNQGVNYEDQCAGLNPGTVGFACDSACQDDIVSRVSLDYGNPVLGPIGVSVTKTKPTNPAQIRQTVVVTAGTGAYCGNGPMTGGSTPGDGRSCTEWIGQVSYVFAGLPQITSVQQIADEIAHEAGHQMGLMHTYQPTGDDIMGVEGPNTGNHCFSSGAVQVVQGGADICNRATQDDYSRLHNEWMTGKKSP